MEHFFSPNSSGHLRLDAHQSQIIGGSAAGDQKWARGQLKHDGFPVLCSPK